MTSHKIFVEHQRKAQMQKYFGKYFDYLLNVESILLLLYMGD